MLRFGYNAGIPEGIVTVWGARLIAPDDLLWDRQDLVAASDGAKGALVDWLNGPNNGDGAINAALKRLAREEYPDGEEFVAYEDARGIVIANTNRSGGYVYVAAWLKPDVPVVRYDIKRMPITVERWHTHYGWSREEAEKMGASSSEVRIFAEPFDGDGYELDGERAGDFEMGYGGSGPHATARRILDEVIGDGSSLAPMDLRALVPEVFEAARGSNDVRVYAADVLARAKEAAKRTTAATADGT